MARAHLKPLAEAAPPPAAKPAAAAPPPPQAANSSTPPKVQAASGLPPITTEDPWRYLHPARVWPD
jgi:hypothetical protein